MTIGDIVKPINGYVLRSEIRGSLGNETFETYEQAVIVSLDPFILVSEERDRLWNMTVYPKNFKETGDFATREFIDWMNTKTFKHHRKKKHD